MSAQERKAESEDEIVRALIRAGVIGVEAQELSWTELLNQTRLSRRTLNLRLRDMEKRGLVRRRLDTSSDKYPPPVFYKLIPGSRVVADILRQHNSYDRTIEKELTFDESSEEFLEKLTRKLSPIVVYALLKSIDSGSNRPLGMLENLRFTLKKFLVYKQSFDQSDSKALLQKFSEFDNHPATYKSDIDSLTAILRKKFPETRDIDEAFAKPRKRSVRKGPSLNPPGRERKLSREKEKT